MEVILKYLEFIPAYAADLIALLTAPKTFLKSVNVATDTNWSRALRFFVFSAVASFLLIRLSGLPYQAKDENFLVGLSKSVVLWAVGVLFGAAAIKISWKLTGGKASFDSILLTHMYVVSVSLLSINCITLAESGLVGRSNFYSGFARDMGAIGVAESLSRSFPTDAQIKRVFSLIVDAVELVWIIATWGAYRDLNSASRPRSFAAFIVCGLIFIPIWGILLLLLEGTALPPMKP